MKREATYWKTLFAKYVLDKEPDAIIYKEFLPWLVWLSGLSASL